MRVLHSGTANAPHQRQGSGATLPDGTFQLPSGRVAGGSAAASVNGPAALASAPSLLALQEFADRDRRRRKMVQSGFSLLHGLDLLHHDLLNGDVTPERAADLADQLRRLQIEQDEPALGDVLRQIELRCAVELAKLEQPAAR